MNFNPRFPRGKRRREIIIMARNLISIHAPREGSDLFILISPFYFFNFNPRFPRGKRRLYVIIISFFQRISIHASRGGSDSQHLNRNRLRKRFQSTLPAGEATHKGLRQLRKCIISIHASRGGSDSTVKLSPDDRTKQYGFREPGFSSFLSAASMLFFFWALGVRAYRIMVSLGSYPFFVPI